MITTLIHSDSTFLIWSVLLLLAAVAFWADTTKLGRNISGVALILMIAMLLSNFAILPKVSSVYDVVWSYFVPLAIPLLLIKADLKRVLSETRGMLIAFLFGAIGTSVGALLGYYILPLGEESAKLAGVFSATYIGGSMNMVAVSQAVELSPSIATASIAADNVVGVVYLAFLAMASSITLLQRWFKSSNQRNTVIQEDINNSISVVPLNLKHICFVLGISFAICGTSQALATFLGLAHYSIMFITALTLIVANVFTQQLKNIQGDFQIGLFFMYIFFAALGISADVAMMFDNALIVALYAVIIVFCHAVFIFGLSRFFKLELMEVIITSNACASGPASAAALAAGKGRQDLVVPAVLLGVLGYAVANFIGVMIAVLLKA